MDTWTQQRPEVGSDNVARWLANHDLVAIAREELETLQAYRWERQALLDALRAHGIEFQNLGEEQVTGWTWRIVVPAPPLQLIVGPQPYRLLRPIVYGALSEFKGKRTDED